MPNRDKYPKEYAKTFFGIGWYSRKILSEMTRSQLRRALCCLRRQDARPKEANPAAAQYDGIATTRSVFAEYRRRGWKIPKRSKFEQS